MRITHRAFVSAAALVLISFAPARASADVLLTPFAGVSFLDGDHRKGVFGAAVGFGGAVGVELEAARTLLGRFGDVPIVDLNARLTTYMGNLMLRLPVGPIQPYVTGGVGVVQVTGNVDIPFVGNLVSVSANDFGWNVGGGVMVFPASNFGIRADVRRFQTTDISWDDLTDIGGIGDLPLPQVDFWRATAGLTFRF